MKQVEISTQRLEAFSDGIIAIIMTIMVFDLKLPDSQNEERFGPALLNLLPRFISYTLSFITLAIMWVNHHQLFHQIKSTDRHLLWYNLHLLFWMSLVPSVTNFMGNNPLLDVASVFYGLIFMMCALAFTMLRSYVINKQLLLETISPQAHEKIKRKNRLALVLYLIAAIAGMFSVYLSLVLFLIIPAMYFVPEKITHLTTNQL